MIGSYNLQNLQTEKIDIIVFDLDGTLYEDTHHFSYYADCLATFLDPELKISFYADLQAVINGRHVLRLGRVFDVKRDLVLSISPAGQVQHVWNWAGNEVAAEKVLAIYPEAVTCDMDQMLYMGDGWWLPAACAFHYGLTSTSYCYKKTKDWLAETNNALTPVTGLKEALKSIKEHKPLILATNSTAEDTKRLLHLLGLTEIFTEVNTSCNKPAQTENLFTGIIKRHNCGFNSILSIGDNYLSEIAPIQRLGGQTVLIDPHDVFIADNECGPRINSIAQLIPLFLNFSHF